MQQTKSNRSYSEFFTSGFRAMTSRARRRPLSTFATSSMTSSTTPSTFIEFPDTASSTRSTRRNSIRNITTRHLRTVSMIGPPSVKADVSPRQRRSSVVSFSSWLFDRKTPTVENSLSFSASPQKNSKEIHGNTEITEVWITAGGPYTPSSISRSTEDTSLFQTIDPFAASPDSKSFFIDLSETPPPRNPKRESFLSFSSSPDRSFLHLSHRERPTSIQTMPLPSRSRRSSYQFRPPSRDKSDCSWTLAEETRASTPEPFAEDLEWIDPAQGIDWRQFHVELLRDEA